MAENAARIAGMLFIMTLLVHELTEYSPALEEKLARLQGDRDRTVEPPDSDYVDSASQADSAENAVSTLFLPRSGSTITGSGSARYVLC